MTKYNIRLRRKSLTSGQIERHKDFRAAMGMRPVESRPTSNWRLVALLAGIVFVIIMIVFGITSRRDKKTNNTNPDQEIYNEFKTE